MPTANNYSESMFPQPFDEGHLDALRSLLAFAKGQVREWKHLGGDIGDKDKGLDQPPLSKFIQCVSKLDFDGEMKLIRALHRDLYAFLRPRDPRLIEPLIPAFKHLYVGDTFIRRSAWRSLEIASQGHLVPEKMAEVIESVVGCYYIFRYGVDGEGQNSVYKSVIEIFENRRYGQNCLAFRAHYPPTGILGVGSDASITGDILSFGQYMFFLGHDLNMDVPYALAAKRALNPGRADAGAEIRKESQLHGLLMRFEGYEMVFTARAYLSRTDEDWDTACSNVELVEAELFADEYPDFGRMQAFINNVITGTTRPVLTDYRPGARTQNRTVTAVKVE